jgi:hypothetical protein
VGENVSAPQAVNALLVFCCGWEGFGIYQSHCFEGLYMKLVHLAAVVPLLAAGCATAPRDIAPAYVSPVLYQNLTCQQLAGEAARVSQAAAAASGQQSDQQGRDAVAVTAAVVLFWPALFFVQGDKANAAEIARLKGEMQAIEQANIAKNCGIKFQS